MKTMQNGGADGLWSREKSILLTRVCVDVFLVCAVLMMVSGPWMVRDFLARIGGGRIMVTSINGLACELTATSPTLIVQQRDVAGVVSDVSTILAANSINIGIMKVGRDVRGGTAYCIIECDEYIKDDIVEKLRKVKNVLSVTAVNITVG